MTKKIGVIIIICFFFLLIIWALARYFKLYATYNIISINMEPTYRLSDKILGSSIPAVKNGDIVGYLSDPLPYEDSKEKYEVIGRIVAEEGNTVQVKNAILFVNDKMVDDTLNLGYWFLIKNENFNFKPSTYELENKIFKYSPDYSMLNFSYNEIIKYRLLDKCIRYIDTIPNKNINSEAFNVNGKNTWNFDNFGPVKVPTNCFFILGDNRSNSADSRIRGFIPKDKIIVKILN